MRAYAISENLGCWKWSTLTSYLTAFVGGVVASATLGTVVKKFDGRCPLYTKIDLIFDSTCVAQNCSSIHVVGGDDARLWEAKETCDFNIFTAVGASIYAFIMAYFILVCDRTERISQGSGSRNRMTSLFFPLLITSLVFAILMLVSSVRVLNGTNIFCESIRKSISLSCSEAQFYSWKEFALVDYFYMTLLAGLISSWVSAGAFICSVIILLLRCVLGVDYNAVYIGKLIESRSVSHKSVGRDYGSATSTSNDLQKASSLPIPYDYETEAGPSSASI